MIRVKDVKALPGYELFVTFNDGTSGKVYLQERLFGPMFEPLKAPEVFNQVEIDPFGAVCWPNGADLAPDALYEKVLQRQKVS